MKNWNDCLADFSARKITPDLSKTKSLIETAHERIEQSNKDINEKSANFIFEDYYTSILELFQSLVQINGYNVKNHLCLGYFLRDVLKKENLFQIFDDLRFKRNSLVYYGKRMDLRISRDAINKAKILFHKLNNMLKYEN